MITKKAPENGRKEERVRNEWSHKALRCLKQARRCEQIIYRSSRLSTEGTEDEDKVKTYTELNNDAAKLIKKNVDNNTQ